VVAVHPSLGEEEDPAERRAQLLDVVGEVQGGQLSFSWIYRADMHREATVEAVAADFADALRRIASDCREVS
jgi:hypothetical protein